MSQTCPFCRFSIPDGAVVCGHCGAEKRIVPAENTDTDGNVILAALVSIGLAVSAWFIYKTGKAVLIGAVGGFIFGMWGNLITRVGKGLLYGVIAGVIFYFIFSMFGWPKVGAVIGLVLGFLSGVATSDTEERWFR